MRPGFWAQTLEARTHVRALLRITAVRCPLHGTPAVAGVAIGSWRCPRKGCQITWNDRDLETALLDLYVLRNMLRDV